MCEHDSSRLPELPVERKVQVLLPASFKTDGTTAGPKNHCLLPFAAALAGASSAAAVVFVCSPMGIQPADEVALQVPSGHDVKSMTGCSSHTEARQQRALVGSTPQS